MTILYTLATISGIFLAFASLPQAIKIFRSKSASDISPITYLITITGGLIWILYGFSIQNLPIILTNIVGIMMSIIILIGWFLYGHGRQQNRLN